MSSDNWQRSIPILEGTLPGAPVTTVDFDFVFRDSPLNREKLKKARKRAGCGDSPPVLSGVGNFAKINEEQ